VTVPEDELVPELHDIGKLIDNEALSQETGLDFAHHYFSDQKFRPLDLSSANLPVPVGPTWAAIRYHGGRVLGPNSQLTSPAPAVRRDAGDALPDVYLVILADHLASSTSRSVAQEETGDERRENWPPDSASAHCLWRDDPGSRRRTGPLISTRSALHDLLAFVAKNPSAATFYERYADLLTQIPEEKGFPRDVTTLLTHCNLVGKYYRVLRSCTERTNRGLAYVGNEQRVYGRDERGSRPRIPGMETEWPFRLVRCKVTFPQHPARAHDLGVFLRLAELMADLGAQDTVLLHTLTTLWMFLPTDKVIGLRDALKPLLDAGFIVGAEVAEAPLCDLSSNIFYRRPDLVQHIVLHPDMPETIPLTHDTPRICELCHVRPSRPAPERDEESGVEEFLCAVCAGFREKSSREGRFNKLGGSWEKENFPVAWVRIALDYDRLWCVLKDLFRRYVKANTDLPDDTIREHVNQLRDAALMVDFTRDYNDLLRHFADALRRDFGDASIEEIAGERPELLVVALKEAGQAFKIVDTFETEFRSVFPLCEDDSPISLSISISNAKYPFFEHWRFLDAPQQANAIRIQAVGRARLELSIPRFRALRNLGLEETKASSKLHNAAAVFARTDSHLLEQVDLLDGIKKFPNLFAATSQGFSVADLLAYHKIAGIGGVL